MNSPKRWIVAFEIAFRLKNPNAVRETGNVILSLAESDLLLRGTDILAKVEEGTSLSACPSLLYDLVAGGVLVCQHPSRNIEEYLFEINSNNLRNFFQKEVFVASVVQQYEMHRSTIEPLEISYVVTIPSKFTNSVEEFEDIEPALIRLIAGAKKDLWIVNPFFDEYGAQRILPSMIGAVQNGVRIRILGRELGRMSGSSSSTAVKSIASAFITEGLVPMIEVRDFYCLDEQGHQIYALHTKMMLADESTAYIGSANLTRYSLRSNFELGVILEGEGVRPLIGLIQSLWREAEPIDLKKLLDL